MNDDELEPRLRDALHRRMVAPDAPEGLYGHVGRLGSEEPTRRADGRNELDGGLRFHRLHSGTRLLAVLAAAASIAALLAVSLVWRGEQASGPTVGATASAPASAPASSRPTANSTATSISTWAGGSVSVWYFRRLDAQFAWAVGGVQAVAPPLTNPVKLYVTQDGGATWEAKPTIDLTLANTVTFLDPRHGWIAASQPVKNTSQVTIDTPMAHYVYKTDDGGDTWARSSIPAPADYRIAEFAVLDGKHMWARLTPAAPWVGAGQLDHLWSSADGGATWSRLPGDGTPVQSLFFDSPLEGWAEISDHPSGHPWPEVLHTRDGGRTWSVAMLPVPTGYTWVEGGRNHPTKAGGRLLLYGVVSALGSDGAGQWALVTWTSEDGGASWTVGSTTPVGAGNGLSLDSWGAYFGLTSPDAPAIVRFFDLHDANSMFAFDASSVCAARVAMAQAISTRDAWVRCGSSPDNSHSSLFATSDGGATWRPLLGAP